MEKNLKFKEVKLEKRAIFKEVNIMGFFKNLFIGTAAAKTYQNVYNKPIVIAPPGYVIRGMKQKGLGSKWIIKYSKESQLNITSQFTVYGNTRSVNIGANKFTVDWP